VGVRSESPTNCYTYTECLVFQWLWANLWHTFRSSTTGVEIEGGSGGRGG